MEYRILGPLEVVRDGAPLPLDGQRQRALVAALLVDRNRVVSAERLAEAVWGEHATPNSGNNLQALISRARKALGREAIERRSDGYVLHTTVDSVDAETFETLVRAPRLRPAERLVALETALALWRGDALAEFAGAEFAWPQRARLEELRLAAMEERIDLLLDAGRHSEVIAELEALTAAYPTRERIHAQRMLALYRDGRQTDALEAYRRVRDQMATKLGLEPGPELRALQRAILQHAPELRSPPATRRRPKFRRPRLALVALTAVAIGAVVSLNLAGAPTRSPTP